LVVTSPLKSSGKRRCYKRGSAKASSGKEVLSTDLIPGYYVPSHTLADILLYSFISNELSAEF